MFVPHPLTKSPDSCQTLFNFIECTMMCVIEQVQHFSFDHRDPFHFLQYALKWLCQSITVLLFVRMPKVLKQQTVGPPAEGGL